MKKSWKHTGKVEEPKKEEISEPSIKKETEKKQELHFPSPITDHVY